jgi:hypothetical protein
VSTTAGWRLGEKESIGAARKNSRFWCRQSALDTRILMRVLSWGLRVQGTLVGFVKHVSARAHRSGAVACPGVRKTVSLAVSLRVCLVVR